jgi:hypothetical protein
MARRHSQNQVTNSGGEVAVLGWNLAGWVLITAVVAPH